MAALVASAGLFVWTLTVHQTLAQTANTATPLSVRGTTDAPAGTAIISGDNALGGIMLELRVKDGQKVKRGEVLAVLSGYPGADIAVRSAEVELEKVKQAREALLSGYRKTEIAMQEVAVRQSEKENRLKFLEMQRSSKPQDQKDLEINVSQQSLEKDKARLKTLQETLASDLTQADSDIAVSQAKLDRAMTQREKALVRSPLDGVVVQIWTHPGERINYQGIVKIVDMSQLGVLADIDETDLGRAVLGGKANISFNGSNATYKGTISRIAPAVKRIQQIDPLRSSATDSRVIQIEISFDDLAKVPPVVGREVRVTFL